MFNNLISLSSNTINLITLTMFLMLTVKQISPNKYRKETYIVTALDALLSLLDLLIS